jgi:tetratricopeptide (TPR) repeat protein
MPAIFSLFNILALLYIFRTAQLSITIWREWADFKSEPLTPHKKSLANQASFFIVVPISVFVHEAAHALAVLATGGEVVEFQYRVFWGYVVPGGTFSAVEMWFIAVAGTLGSLLTGLLIWLAARNARSSSIRYFGLRAVRFQIYFSLIYYPLFTLLGFDGDWRTIYDFSSTPWLSATTLFFHAAILFLFWRLDRQGWFEAPAFPNEASQQQFEQLSAAAVMNPQDIALRLEVIDTLRRGGATHKAKYQLNRLIEQDPDSGLAHLELAAIESAGKETVSKKAADSAQKALDLGLSNPGQNAYAHELIGRYQMERGDLQKAQRSFTAAIEALGQGGSSSVLVGLLILRSQVYRRQKNYNAAYQDLQHALVIAQQSANSAAVQQITSELEILAKHSGQVYSIPASNIKNDY